MIATVNERRHRLIDVQVAIVGLVLVAIGGCNQSPAPVKVFANGTDTPIVISGGSIHFRAKHSVWQTCDGKPASSSTSCYKATFSQADKKHAKKYQFFTADDLTTVPVASVTNGWEIDVVDTNPDNKHMVLVCAESSDFRSCSSDPFNSEFIYVIAVGGGTFEQPDTTGSKILYHDGATTYDYISDIVLNASGGKGGTKETCTNSRCVLSLSE